MYRYRFYRDGKLCNATQGNREFVMCNNGGYQWVVTEREDMEHILYVEKGE